MNLSQDSCTQNAISHLACARIHTGTKLFSPETDWPSSGERALFPSVIPHTFSHVRNVSGNTAYVHSAKSVRKTGSSQKCPAAVTCLTSLEVSAYSVSAALLRKRPRDRGVSAAVVTRRAKLSPSARVSHADNSRATGKYVRRLPSCRIAISRDRVIVIIAGSRDDDIDVDVARNFFSVKEKFVANAISRLVSDGYGAGFSLANSREQLYRFLRTASSSSWLLERTCVSCGHARDFSYL